MRLARLFCLAASVMILLACGSPTIRLFPGADEPLQEFVLEGSGKEKVLLISVEGQISNTPRQKTFYQAPSVVEQVVSQLKRAEKDASIRALVVKIDSPGGSATASDTLYHEVLAFKNRTQRPVVAALMGLAASGGYYASLPADLIIAHPTTVTGSVGAVFIRPEIFGLMEKLGLNAVIHKSGENKDMGSPLRRSTAEEEAYLQHIIDQLGRRFLDHVVQHRKLNDGARAKVASARVFSADEALSLGLVDRIGYLQDAVSEARRLAGISDNAAVVVYRRSLSPDATAYSSADMRVPGWEEILKGWEAAGWGGFYYLWPSAAIHP